MDDDAYLNKLSNDRLAARHIDELIGLARGLCADGGINQKEAEYLQSWLAASQAALQQPLILGLYRRIESMLSDGNFDPTEQTELYETLLAFTGNRIELGEVLFSSTLPLCSPAPNIEFFGKSFVFTGTFMIGQRRDCERLVLDRGGSCGNLTKNTDYLIIGAYATEAWKHSSMGNKILKACEMRDRGLSISIVSESHWQSFL